jgi:glycosyltransferase involved in cell wall biosynthesis
MPGFLAALDLLCVPSLYGEGFPNVIGEAMACGVRCLATDVGDARDIIAETGLVVAPGDVPALAEGMTALLSAAGGQVAAAAEACRRRVQENYSLERIAALYEELYASC